MAPPTQNLEVCQAVLLPLFHIWIIIIVIIVIIIIVINLSLHYIMK